MTGVLKMYKYKSQLTVVLLSTKVEFAAAADTGKMIQYVRSILKQ